MPRRYARIALSIGDDADYCALTVAQQHLYEMLLRQRDLSACGALSYNATRIARQAADLTPALVDGALAVLVHARFIVFDATTGELAIRTYLRNDGVLDNPNVLKAAAKAWAAIHSPLIRQAVVDQLPEPLQDTWPALQPLPPSARQQFSFPVDDDRVPSTSLQHPLAPVDNSLSSVDSDVDREREVLVAVSQRRIARARDHGLIIHSLPAYTSRVVENTRVELGMVIHRAVINNPSFTAHQLAELIDHAPPPSAAPVIETREPLEWPS